MKAESFGRKIGVGMRVASNILRDRAGEATQSSAAAASRPASSTPATPRPAAPGQKIQSQVAGKAQAAGRGARKFGQAIWGPFFHAGSVLWLEITGLFFGLFAVFFAQNIYRVHAAWKQGAEHQHFLLYMVLTALFIWFSASSFLRASRRGKKRR